MDVNEGVGDKGAEGKGFDGVVVLFALANCRGGGGPGWWREPFLLLAVAPVASNGA